MVDSRPVLMVVGLLLVTLALAMSLPAAVDLLIGHPDWMVFAASSALTLFVGLALLLGSRMARPEVAIREVFLLTTLGWVGTATFAALPFAFGAMGLSFTDAFFEAMSGITTTGSSVLAAPQDAPPGILLWRALLQWLGGVGVVVMAMTVLPLLKIGGMQMFRVEAGETHERAMPRAARVTGTIALVYVLLTAVLALSLGVAGLGGFDAIVHAMTTISTGGFSTHEASIAHFDNPLAETLVTAGMVVGGMPFLLVVPLLQGKLRRVLRDDQLRWYLSLLGLSSLTIGGWLWASLGMDPLDALRHGAFTVASFMTGCGFFTLDYTTWSGLPLAILFFLTFIGGCAGSTAAGIKVFRFQVLFANARVQAARLLRPHAVMIANYNGKPISEGVIDSVMGFLFVYMLTFAVLAMLLGMLGLDFMTAMSAAASAVSNVGPGLTAAIGPTGDYAALPAAAKWLLSAGMLLGRLEMFTVLVLFVPAFWRD
ncbi:MAG: TrkH family potassium uptake protein [Alphaproteobacteria bacterium]|nr:TrkH family potassium uptake protein [Alphaproteobacteria bacterium]